MYQICVSGAAKGESAEHGKTLAAAAGKSIAKAGHSLMTGATTGLPNVAAEDAILYTGLHYSGRDALLINSADAVVSIGGRLGTLHEFTIAAETHTPIGFLIGAGGIGDQVEALLGLLPNAKPELIIFDDDPDKLLARLTKLLDKTHSHYSNLYD
jgi:predicted Rossmann-fold nucleotide-binding protein